MASDAVHDLNSLFSSEGRDFLIRNNGAQVKISSLIGKIVGLYFSASWCPPCRLFTPKLAQLYKDLASKNNGFEVIFISSDRDEHSFKAYFSKMPWLSIPFEDSETKEKLKLLFELSGIPRLVVLDANGKVSTDEGVKLVRGFGVDAYPFTYDRKKQLLVEKEEEEAKKNNIQTIASLLVSTSRNYVVSNYENQIPVSELEGKLIGLYFSKQGHEQCDDFTPKLSEAYNKLKEREEKFEIVLISLDDEDEDLFKESFKTMPWLALPFKDEKCQQLKLHFEVSDLPALVIIGQDGKTSNPNAVELIKENGIDAYPFTPKKPDILDQTLSKKNDGTVKVSCCCSGSKSNDKSKNDDEETKEETKEENEETKEEKEGCKG